MARLRQPPPPAATASDVPALLIEPLHPDWRDHALAADYCRRAGIRADLPEPDRYAVTWRGKHVGDGITRWRTAVTAWAMHAGIRDTRHPERPDWQRLSDLGIRPPRARDRAEAIGSARPPTAMAADVKRALGSPRPSRSLVH